MTEAKLAALVVSAVVVDAPSTLDLLDLECGSTPGVFGPDGFGDARSDAEHETAGPDATP